MPVSTNTERMVGATELARNLPALLAEANRGCVLYITRFHEPAGVLIGAEQWDGLLDFLAAADALLELRSAENKKHGGSTPLP